MSLKSDCFLSLPRARQQLRSRKFNDVLATNWLACFRFFFVGRGWGREEKRRVMEGRGGTYQEDSGLPRVAVPVANVRRNLLLSESDRRRFSPYVSTLMWIVFSRVASCRGRQTKTQKIKKQRRQFEALVGPFSVLGLDRRGEWDESRSIAPTNEKRHNNRPLRGAFYY